jgi:hypothetical protein
LLSATLALALGAVLAAQTTQSVPLSNPAQPATVKVNLFRGSITVRAGAAGAVTVTTTPGPDQKGPLPSPAPPAPPGMRLLNAGGAFAATQATNNVVIIHGSPMSGDADATVTVPASTALDLHTMKGDITVTGVSGELSVQTMNGDIALHQVGGSIVAHALHGKITAAISQLGTKPSSFSSLNGDIDITLPADARANLRLQDDRGGVYLDNGFDFVQTASKPASPDLALVQSQARALSAQADMFKAQASGGPGPAAPIFKSSFQLAGPTIAGTLNGGGVDLLLQDFRGNIYLHKAK